MLTIKKNRQHLHRRSLVQAYSYRSCLQITFPSIPNNFDLGCILNCLSPQELINKCNQNIAVPKAKAIQSRVRKQNNCPCFVRKAHRLACRRNRQRLCRFTSPELVHHESSMCWTNKKRADWPKLSQTVHVLNRFCWTDWLKTSQIVSSRSTLHYITLHYITYIYIYYICNSRVVHGSILVMTSMVPFQPRFAQWKGLVPLAAWAPGTTL